MKKNICNLFEDLWLNHESCVVFQHKTSLILRAALTEKHKVGTLMLLLRLRGAVLLHIPLLKSKTCYFLKTNPNIMTFHLLLLLHFCTNFKE